MSASKWGVVVPDIMMREGCKKELHEKHGACYMCCDRCNYDMHQCHFCGTGLTHDSYEDSAKTRRHWLSDCRPDLLPHEPGPLCTWGHRDPSECYGDHVSNKFECETDGPMT